MINKMEDGTHYIDKDPDTRESEMEHMKCRVQSLNQEEVLQYIDYMEEKWCLKKGSGFNSASLGYTQLLNPEDIGEDGRVLNYDMKAIDDRRSRYIKILSELYHRASAINIQEFEPEDDGLKVSRRINRIIEQVKDAFCNINTHKIAYERAENPTVEPEIFDSDPATFRGVPMDDSKVDDATPFQKSILCALKTLYMKRFRRYKGDCCEQITYNGYDTRAWKPLKSINEFVYELGNKEYDFGLWQNLTSNPGVFRHLIEHLSNCQDVQFPEIIKDRHMWSFRNGVFFGKCWTPETGAYDCKFYSYESREFRSLDPTKVSCKFFDQQFDDFDHIEDWYDIPTPHFQGVLDYQKFDESVSRWMYVMGGRLCFDTGELDGWQVIPFLKGIARSGKSTVITKIFKKFYEPEDVKTVSNNIEKKFGLSSVYNALMFIAPEIKGDFCLEQAEFQSMVSGEDVSIAIKGQTAKSVEWKCPGVLGGNEIPNWKDNSGSVLRRILPWNFAKQVKDADTQLDEKLNQEIPAILLKCVRAYLDYAQKYRNKDIWNVVPEYFKTVQKQVAMVASTLHNFLESTNLVFGEELYVPQKIFVQVFNQHCQANNLGRPKFNPDFYAGPFSSREIEVREESLTYKGRVYPKQPFIFGLDVLEDTLQFSDDH